MIYINDTPVLSDVKEIINRLRFELQKEGYNLLKDRKVSGDNLMVTCINHKGGHENHPSCGIKLSGKSAGVAHCFKCGYTADLPTFISNAFGKNDGGIFGYKWLMKNFVNVSVENREELDLDLSRNNKKPEEVEYLSDEYLEEYRYTHSYMYERGLTDNIINYFDVGYDKEDNAIVFPLYDLNGRVPFVIKRAVYNKYYYFEPENSQKRNTIYGLYQIYDNIKRIEEVWLTEGPIDCLTCWTQGIPAISFMGSQIAQQQIELLNKLPIRELVMAFDDDEAGRKAEIKIANNINKLLYKVKYAEKGDINDQETPLKRLKKVVYPG